MSNTQPMRQEHVKAIVNTGDIITMLNKVGLENDQATEIAREIDVQINAVIDEKLGSEDVTKIVDERLNGVATKDFVRAEIQEVKTEVQTVRTEMQEFKTEVNTEIQTVRTEIQEFKTEVNTEFQKVRTEIQTVRTDVQKGFRQNLIAMVGFVMVILGALYFALTHHF